MAEAEAMAFHGWGFDASCWQPWEEILAREKIPLKCAERGYFGASRVVPVFQNSKKLKIILAHSFGLHLCSEEHLSRADVIVVFGGFLNFHPVAAQYRRRSRQVVQQMMNLLEENPQKVIEDFYTNCYAPQQAPDLSREAYNKAFLIEDLKRLNAGEANLRKMKKADKICILHGFKDRIVPRAKGRQLYDVVRGKASYLEVKDAGHALAFTHTEQCWHFIKPEIAELIS